MSFQQQGYVGYTTKEALLQLRSDIQEIIEAREEVISKSSFLWKFRSSLIHHSCRKSIYHWTDFVTGILITLSLLIGYLSLDGHVSNLGFLAEIIIVTLMFFANAFMTCKEDVTRRSEIVTHLEQLLNEMQQVAYETPWYPYNYLNLNCPIAPSVSVQWTFRDGEVVNLPCTLLVKGDIILLRPGQEVPVRCKSIEDIPDSTPMYEAGEIFLPNLDSDDITAPKQIKPLQSRLYCVDETLFMAKVRSILNAGKSRPNSVLQNEIYATKFRFVHVVLLPLTYLLVIIASLCRYFYWPNQTGYWPELVFILPAQTVVPMLLTIFPPIYHLLNWFGLARLQLVYKQQLLEKKPEADIDSVISDHGSDKNQVLSLRVKCTEIINLMKEIILGKSGLPCRTVDTVHVLGSVTSFCCLDKKGILSWPIPVIEKVFFLANRRQSKSKTDIPPPVLTSIRESGESDDEIELPIHFSRDAAVEVLDVSHKLMDPYELIFDNPNWQQHISSLKPLGLNILLNNCNMKTVDAYTQFADHVTVAAHGTADAIAVVNRRCLCELPKQIGFAEQAMEGFDMEFDICMYKSVDDQTSSCKPVHGKSFTKHKTPMPNMMSVVVRELNSGCQQLMTQGTADIMLDLCSDYWDGTDLCPLLDADRKRILDFYHRHSMSAYCTAFAYSPVIDKISSKLGEHYIQLPVGAFYTYPDFSSPTTIRSWDLESLDHKIKTAYDRRYSADSAIGRTETVISDLEGCMRSQCNQIFIGMVTMQYQAMPDIVQLIEQLEHSCIRFVHFSKENELRSRVFSEKMGLESGWNCHISLLSENHDSISHSSSHHDITKRGSTRRTLSNSSTRHSSSQSLHRELTPKRSISIQDEEARQELLGPKQNSDVEANSSEVKIRRDSRAESVERHPLNDEGFQCSASVISSHSTDSLVIDTQNRAKLPKGIDAIRPHLKNVDNVPLLVSLFTDCTPEATLEMIQIMQENGEVVCVIGSTANINNIDIFLQADACIGLEPLYPNVCTRHQPVLELLDSTYPSPMNLSNRLNALPCSFTAHREDNIDIRSLILEARAHVQLMRNCFQFYLCCSIAVSMIQTLTSVLLLPPILSTRHVLWLILVVIPTVSVSLVWHSDRDDRLMATGKNHRIHRPAIILEFTTYALLRFVPSMIICILCFGLNLHDLCLAFPDSDCNNWFGNLNSTGTGDWAGWYRDQRIGFCLAQNFALCQIVFYLLIVSAGFVHRSSLIWRRHPFDNLCWVAAAPGLVLLQVIFSSIDVSLIGFHSNAFIYKTSDIPLATWLISGIWLVLLCVLSEIIKMREIRSFVRYQKRAKLDFGTKLGMNSPF